MTLGSAPEFNQKVTLFLPYHQGQGNGKVGRLWNFNSLQVALVLTWHMNDSQIFLFFYQKLCYLIITYHNRLHSQRRCWFIFFFSSTVINIIVPIVTAHTHGLVLQLHYSSARNPEGQGVAGPSAPLLPASLTNAYGSPNHFAFLSPQPVL